MAGLRASLPRLVCCTLLCGVWAGVVQGQASVPGPVGTAAQVGSRLSSSGAAGGTTKSEALRIGRAIFHYGLGRDPIRVRLRHLDVEMPASAYGCARCHGANGTGDSEGGVLAPSLVLPQHGSAREVGARLEAALQRGRGADGRALGDAMPTFVMSARDRSALAVYLRTLPYAPEPGVSSDSVRLGISFHGSGLDASARAAAMRLLKQQAALENATGGFFGRQLVVASADEAEVVLLIGFALDENLMTRQFLVRPPSEEGSLACGHLHGQTSEQVRWLLDYLEREEGGAHVIGPLAEQGARRGNANLPPGGTGAVVYLGGRNGLATWAQRAGAHSKLYAFTDLSAQQAAVTSTSTAIGAEVVWASPVDLPRQVKGAQAIAAREKALSDPRAASVVLELSRALSAAMIELRALGRRVGERLLCARLEHAAQERRRVFLNDGEGRTLWVTAGGHGGQ